MKSSLYLHLNLTESESTQIAVAAFYAGMPLTEWVKQTLLNNSTVERPTSLPAQPAAVRRTAALAPPTPQPDGDAREPVAAAEAELEVEDEETEPVATPVAAPVAEATPEPPAPPPPAPPEPEPESAPPAQKQKRTRQTHPPGIVPRGFEPIMQLAEKIVAARKQIAEQTGATSGYQYNMKMREWYTANGLADLAVHFRQQFGDIGRNATIIRKWATRQPAGSIADDILPYTLLKQFENTATEADVAAVAGEEETESEPAEPATDTAPDGEGAPEDAPPSDETLIVVGGKLQRTSLSGYLAGNGNGAANGSTPANVELRKPQPGSLTVRNFDEVALEQLNPYDSRCVRRFTERIVNLGGATVPLSEADIALAIRKIRGNESGDNPPTAMCLMRLGVIGGASGAFRLRPEYVNRFDNVRSWAGV
jgi:hypothetical protein